MKLSRLPYKLDVWLENRGFNVTRFHQVYGENAENVVFSAACECLEDCESCGNSNNPYVEYGYTEPGDPWYDDFKKALVQVNTLRNFVKREAKTHKRLDLSEWYDWLHFVSESENR